MSAPKLHVAGFASWRKYGREVLVRLTLSPKRGYWTGYELITGRECEPHTGSLTPLADDAPDALAAVAEGERLEAVTPTIDDQLEGRAARCKGCDEIKVAARLDDGLCGACAQAKREQEERAWRERDRNDDGADDARGAA